MKFLVNSILFLDEDDSNLDVVPAHYVISLIPTDFPYDRDIIKIKVNEDHPNISMLKEAMKNSREVNFDFII